METVENKYITVAYKLYTMEDGEKELFEEAKAEHPFQFISGLGTTLEDFENQITALSKVINLILPFRQIRLTDNMTNNTLSTFRNISSKLTVNSIANTSKKVTSYLCRLAMASV